MYKIVLLRHGQTVFNKEKIFCGWTESELTEKGIEEAKSAGKSLKTAGFSFDIGFCSVLERAIKTLNLALEEMDAKSLPVEYSWRLNERNYGALQGQKHADIAEKYSPEQVQKWRRSFSDKPLQLTEDDPRYPGNDPKYASLDKKDLPLGESLEDTIARVLPYWENGIVPQIKANKKIIIAASGNSLRALVKYIDDISNDDIVGLEILHATPLVYELDENLKTIKKYYLKEGGVETSV